MGVAVARYDVGSIVTASLFMMLEVSMLISAQQTWTKPSRLDPSQHCLDITQVQGT